MEILIKNVILMSDFYVRELLEKILCICIIHFGHHGYIKVMQAGFQRIRNNQILLRRFLAGKELQTNFFASKRCFAIPGLYPAGDIIYLLETLSRQYLCSNPAAPADCSVD